MLICCLFTRSIKWRYPWICKRILNKMLWMFQMLSLLLLPASLPACLVLRLSFAVVLVARFLCRPMFGTFCATNYSGPTNFSSKHHWMEWRTQWNSRGGGEREGRNTRRIDSKWAVTFSIIFNCTIKVSKTCFLLLFVLKSGICCGFADGFFPLPRVTSRSRHRLCGLRVGWMD